MSILQQVAKTGQGMGAENANTQCLSGLRKRDLPGTWTRKQGNVSLRIRRCFTQKAQSEQTEFSDRSHHFSPLNCDAWDSL